MTGVFQKVLDRELDLYWGWLGGGHGGGFDLPGMTDAAHVYLGTSPRLGKTLTRCRYPASVDARSTSDFSTVFSAMFPFREPA